KQMPKATAENQAAEVADRKINEANDSLILELRGERISRPKERGESIDLLLGSTTGALALVHEISVKSLNPGLQDEVIARGTSHTNALVRDLFERFVPEEKRVKRLGTDIRPEEI